MSTTVDSRVVEMQFDNSKFESNVKTSMSTLDKLKSALNFSGVSDSFSEITTSAGKVDMSGLSGAIETVHQKFSAMEVVAVTALVNITNQAIATGEQLIKSLSVDNISAGWDKFTEKTQSVATLVSQGYDLDTVTEQLERLNWYTDETSYNFTDMVENIAKFTASGQDLETSVTAMEGIANWAALSGQNATTASRAMYQLSQAMSAGYMRLEDYKSIQNASMDTEEFRQKCIDAAVALGTLQDNADGTYTSIVDGASSTTFTLSQFTTGLTDGAWLTSEVMMDVFNEYSSAVDQIYEYSEEKGITASEAIEELGDSVDEFGLKAFKAAQEARSWADVIDSVKDAVSTGWMNTFEYIFGNEEEAIELWTDLANAMYDVFAEGGNARNEMLAEWKELGGRDVLVDAFWTAWDNIGEVLGTVKEAFRDIFPSTTADQLYSFTEGLKTFADNLKMSDENLDNLKSTFKGLFSILDIAKQALSAVFNGVKTLFGGVGSLASSILGVTGSIGDWLVALDESIEKSDIFNKAVEKIISVIKTFANIVSDNLTPVMVSFGEGGEGLAGVIEVIFDKIVDLIRIVNDLVYTFTGVDLSTFSENIITSVQNVRNKVVNFVSEIEDSFDIEDFKENVVSAVEEIRKKFSDFIEKIEESDVFTKITEGVSNFVDKAKEKFSAPGFDLFHTVLTAIETVIGAVITALGNLKDKIVGVFDEIGEKVSGNSFLTVLGAVWTAITKIGSALTGVLGTAIKGLGKAILNADFNSFFDILNSLVSTGVIVSIAETIHNFASGLGEVKSLIKSVKSGVTDIFEGLGGVLEDWSANIKADTLLKIAASVGVLTIALIALTSVDSEKMGTAIATIGSLMAELVAAMTALQKLTGANSTGLKDGITNFLDSMSNAKQYNNLIKMAGAIAILAGALAIIGTIDADELGGSVTAITVLITELVAATTAMNKLGGKVSGTSSMIAIAASILILSSAVKSLGELDWGEVGKGLTSVTVLCVELVASMIALNKLGGSTSGATTMIAIAAAIKILASAVGDFGELSWGEIVKGLASVGVLLAELAAFSLASGNSKNLISSGLAMIEVAAAMKILASAVEDFGALSWTEIAKGLVTMGVALTEVTVALNLLPKGVASKAAGLVIMGEALKIVADAVSDMGGMSWEEIAKGLVTMGVALTEMVVALNLMQGTLAGSAALLVAAAAIAALVPSLKSLGEMSIAEVATSLITLAGALTVLGVAAMVLSPLTTTMLALGAAMALVGAGLLAAGVGLSAIAVGITALAASMSVGLSSIVEGIKSIILAVVTLIPDIVVALAEGLVEICAVIADGASTIGEAVVAVILAVLDILRECIPEIVSTVLEIVVGVLDALVEYMPSIVTGLINLIISVIEALGDSIPDLLIAVMEFFGKLFEAIIEALNNVDTETLLETIACVGLLSGVVAALSSVSALIPAAMAAMAEMSLLVVEMGAIFAAIGALAQIPGLTWLIDEGADLLESIGNAIGSFAGGIIGGFLGGVTSEFPKIGSDLSGFMENAQPFIEGASQIDSSVASGMAALAGAILALTAADILEGLTSWLTGGSSFVEFGAELAEFGPYLKDYSDSVTDVDSGVVEASANAALVLAEMAKNLPNSGGLISWIAGENKLSDFGAELAAFGPYLKDYSDSVTDVDADVVSASADAASVLGEMAENLPNQGGMVSWFTGDNTLSVFGAELAEFGPYLKDYADSVDGLDTDDVVASAAAASAIAEMAENLPNQGGMVSWFTGDNTLSVFGAELAEFGPYLKDYADSVANIKDGVVEASAAAASTLAELANNLPNQGGVVSWFTGDNTLSDFGEELSEFGPYLKKYAKSVANISADDVMSSAYAAEALSDMAANLPKHDNIIDWFTGTSTTLSEFGKELASFGPHMKDYSDSVTGVKSDVVTASASAAKALFEMANNLPEANGLVDWILGTGSISLAQFGEELASFGPHLKDYSDSITGLKTDLITESSTAAKALFEMADNLPTQGDGLLSWFTGTTLSLSAFGEELEALGPSLMSYAQSVDGMPTEAVQNSADAALALANIASALPEQTGGLLSWFTGDVLSLSDFGTELEALGPSLMAYGQSVDGFPTEAATNSANVAAALASVASSLPERSSALLSWFTGDTLSLSAFGEELQAFGPYLNEYAKSIGDVSSDTGTKTEAIADAITKLNDGLPESGGVTQWFTGEKNLATFGENLEAFGNSMNTYYYTVKDIETNTLSHVMDQFRRLITAAEDIQGIDNTGLSAFAANIVLIATESIDEFIDAFDDAEEEVVQAGADFVDNFRKGALDEQKTLTTTWDSLSDGVITLLETMESDYYEEGGEFITQIISGANSQETSLKWAFANLVNSCLSNIEELYTGFESAGQTLVVYFSDGLDDKSGEVKSACATIVTVCLSTIKTQYANFKTVGRNTMAYFINGITAQKDTVKTKAGNNALAAVDGVKAYYNSFYNAGKYLVQGFSKGITATTFEAEAAASAMAKAAADAASDELDINSPSKVGYGIGGYFGLGFVNAISDYADTAYGASEEMADSARNGLSNAISKISDVINGGVDTTPVIRPVLDLSSVERGVGELNAMMSEAQAMSISADLADAYEARTQSTLEVNNDDVVDAITSLRGDVVSLQSAIGNLKVVMDSGALVGQIVTPMNYALAKQAAYEGRGI